MTKESTQSGTLNHKINRQFQRSIKKPPNGGPIVIANPIIPVKIPIAVPRDFPSKLWSVRAFTLGQKSAAPKPCKIRLTISCHVVCERAPEMEKKRKTKTPIVETRLKPIAQKKERHESRFESTQLPNS